MMCLVVLICDCCFFFFKQKTAYEMRISDWGSDVCSSDLMLREDRADESEFVTISYWESVEAMSRFAGDDPRRIHHLERDPEFLIELPEGVQEIGRASCGKECVSTCRSRWWPYH